MPEISRFYGIIIRLFYESGRHRLPHFHAAYGDYLASYTIDPPALLSGTMPRRQHHLVLAWAELHRDELMENWELAELQQPLRQIEGLK